MAVINRKQMGNIKVLRNILGKKEYEPIYANRDEKGRILTYIVDKGDYKLEYNTLKEARLMARIIR